ncbi:MAG TPA: TIGR03086 family metal-binding protein [Actinoplanes sp.]|nr:TIGR03086 family metal-binding protein [Actinoplanes sp.]
MHTIDLRQADATAVRASVAVVAQVSTGDLGRLTPCAEWDLGTLIAHMTAQHRGFAAAAAGRGADLAVWRPDPPGDDPVRAYEAAASAVIDAFAEVDVPGRPFALPEISPDRTFPGRVAIGFHLVDYVVHGWDVAASLGTGFQLPDGVVRAALPIARAVPDGQSRTVPDAAFAPGRPVPAGAEPLAEILALLGRGPFTPRG